MIHEIHNREVEPAITLELIDGCCSTQTKPNSMQIVTVLR